MLMAWEISSRYDSERQFLRMPVCDICGKTIQDEMFHIIGGEKICNECLDDTKVYTDEWAEEH